ncbi:MAG TPA: LysM peptidoglycan-binding domain-containing protein, partial [Opitutaceae bacterium]|nr:LysM peptidoglycan-binding domain-containing protein [Opitutaceae bacterium]
MKIIKILGIAAGLHALALILIFANPGCSYTKAAGPDGQPDAGSPISAAPEAGQAGAPQPAATKPVVIRYSPTRPGTPVASALEAQPVSGVTPATTYKVVRGDSLWSIAASNHLTKADLAAANNLKSTSVLHIGQKLIIPAKTAPAAAPMAGAGAAAAAPEPAEKPSGETLRHTVKPGETLGGIARKYGVRQGDIAVANNITDPRRIQPGQELVIPAKSSGGKQAAGARPQGAAEA